MFLAALFLLGIAYAWRQLGLRHWSEAIPIGVSLAQVFLICASNATLRLAGWGSWPVGLAFCSALWTWRVARKPATGLDSPGPMPVSVGLLAAASALYAILLQSQEIDDDYWIHAPLQGLLLKGDFPPHNPFFPSLELNGHYGRDLLVVVWSKLTGWTTFTAQFWLTALLQPLQILIAYFAVCRSTNSRSSGTAAAFFMALGVQVASRAGLLDTLQNNNPVAQLYLTLVLYTLVVSWKRLEQDRAWDWVVTLGVVLGGLAIVYETHFALCCASSIVVIGRGLLSCSHRARVVSASFIVVLVSLSLACTQGGPFTDLARRLSGNSSSGVVLDPSSRTQSQHVEIHFPKKQLLCLRCGSLTHFHVNELPTGNWLIRSFQMTDPNEGYLPVWNSKVFLLQSWPFFLSPFVMWRAVRRNRLATLWLVSFGYVAYLVPLLVNFGPIFESEYPRWEFAAGIGFSGALGSELGPWLAEALSGPGRLRKLKVVLAAVLFWQCSANARLHAKDLGQMLTLASSQGLSPITLGAKNWLLHQARLGFTGEDWEAAQYLRAEAELGQSFIVDTPEDRAPTPLFESTVSCLTGLRPAGLRLPLEDDMVGIPPFRKRPAVRCFFQSGDPHYLDLQRPDWIFLREHEPVSNPEIRWERVSGRYIGRLGRPAQAWPVKLLSEKSLASPVLAGLSEAESLREGEMRQVSWTEVGRGRLVLVPRPLGQALDFEDAIVYPAGSQSGWWAAPYHQGDYALLAFCWDEQGLHPMGEVARLRLNFSQQFSSAQVGEIEFDRSLKKGQWVRATVQLKGVQLEGVDCLCYLSFTRGARAEDRLLPVQVGEGTGRVSRIPHSQMQRAEARQGRLVLWTRLPESGGSYRVDLFLSAGFGTVFRLRGTEIEVGQ